VETAVSVPGTGGAVYWPTWAVAPLGPD